MSRLEAHRSHVEGLMSAQVKDWRRVTPAFLEAELARLRGAALDMKKLYLPYWIARLTEADVR